MLSSGYENQVLNFDIGFVFQMVKKITEGDSKLIYIWRSDSYDCNNTHAKPKLLIMRPRRLPMVPAQEVATVQNAWKLGCCQLVTCTDRMHFSAKKSYMHLKQNISNVSANIYTPGRRCFLKSPSSDSSEVGSSGGSVGRSGRRYPGCTFARTCSCPRATRSAYCRYSSATVCIASRNPEAPRPNSFEGGTRRAQWFVHSLSGASLICKLPLRQQPQIGHLLSFYGQ